MATINRGILGGFRGKIGNVIGSSWKGIDSMRSMPISVANPRTNKQVNNRDRFGSISKLLSSILSQIVKPLNDRFSQKMSGYNAVAQRSKEAFNEGGGFVPEKLVLSKGKLGVTAITRLLNLDTLGGTVEWSPLISGDFQKATDKAYMTIIDSNGVAIATSSGVVARSVGAIPFVFPTERTAFEEIYVYLSFLSADGTAVSDSSMENVIIPG